MTPFKFLCSTTVCLLLVHSSQAGQKTEREIEREYFAKEALAQKAYAEIKRLGGKLGAGIRTGFWVENMSIDLTGTNVNDKDMSFLDKLWRIESLFLNDTDITDATLKKLERFSKKTGLHSLGILQLRGTKITNEGLKSLKEFSWLFNLDLSNTAVDDSGLKYLEELRFLRLLNLANTKVRGNGLKYINSLNLWKLDLSGTEVSDKDLLQLKKFEHLETLRLANTKVSDMGLVYLKGLTWLQELDLRGTRLTKQGLLKLKGLTNLKVILK